MLDANVCFNVFFTGSVPNCRASSRAWWEEPRRGRCLEGKCRREKGKPEKPCLCYITPWTLNALCVGVFTGILKRTPLMEVNVCVSFGWTEGETSFVSKLFLVCKLQKCSLNTQECVCWLLWWTLTHQMKTPLAASKKKQQKNNCDLWYMRQMKLALIIIKYIYVWTSSSSVYISWMHF